MTRRLAIAVVALTALLVGCATTPEGGAPPPAVSLDAPVAHADPEARTYLEDLRTAIRRGWKYPCVPAPGTGVCAYPEGTVVVDIGIAWDGTLAFTTVVRTSGHPELDTAATDAVRSAAPFPPVPPALKRPGTGVPIRANMKYRQPPR